MTLNEVPLYEKYERATKATFKPIFLFAGVVLIPLLVLGINNGSKIIKIYFTNPNGYVITKAKLLTNYHRKYNDRATYQFNYQGLKMDGSAGSILWGSAGDEITIYFEKNKIENNGILSGLLFLTVGQWLILIVFGFYVGLKLIRNARAS